MSNQAGMGMPVSSWLVGDRLANRPFSFSRFAARRRRVFFFFGVADLAECEGLVVWHGPVEGLLVGMGPSAAPEDSALATLGSIP